MKISLIVAHSSNLTIGINGSLPWRLPADLKWFKQHTSHHHVLMGSVTYTSIGKALPNRTNFVLSKNKNFVAENCFVFDSLESAIEKAKENKENELFIIGGAAIYRQTLILADKIYLTVVHTNIEGDAFFPKLGDEWQKMEETFCPKDEKNVFDMTFCVFERKK